MPALFFVISAPSGTGKSTIIQAVRKRLNGLGYSVSHTSRNPRSNEEDGIDYHFVDKETFRGMIKKGAFVEWATVYGDLYGTSFLSLKKQEESGVDILLDLDAQGARNLKAHFANSVLVYILPPSLENLEERLTQRGTDSDEVIEKRLKRTTQEIKNCMEYDYIVINQDLEKAISEVQSIIISERCRAVQRAPVIRKLYPISFH
jgi:guanylate kinase